MSHGAVIPVNSSPQDLQMHLSSSCMLPRSPSPGSPISQVHQSFLGNEDSAACWPQSEEDRVKSGESVAAGTFSQQSVEDSFEDSTVRNRDTPLVEFSEALKAVAKTLRQVADSKGRAQDEASKWKQKYELEYQRRSLLEQMKLNHVNHFEVPIHAVQRQDLESSNENRSPSQDGNGTCCSKDGICSQQVIRNHSSSQSISEAKVENGQKCSSGKSLFRLAWGYDGKCHRHDVVSFQSGNITTAVRSSKQITLVWETPPQSIFILSKPNSCTVAAFCKELVRWLWEEKKMSIFVENKLRMELIEESSYFSFLQACETDEELMDLNNKVDLAITLGGDGTVLWAASMFKGAVPPLVSFSMGSLGFMTPFQSDRYKECLEAAIKGPVYITLRQRLQCRIIRNAENKALGDMEKTEEYLVLNEVSIDRGMSSYLTNLECYCDNLFVTCVQGDGLILSTPSGSTAYSLAAGGSMVHPQVPGILFTPICPHSLSFRPLILPEYVTLRVQLPASSRGQAWASFDGKDRQMLCGGDALIVQMSAWPVPAACDEESTHDFLRSVREGLHWNLRKSQSFDGAHELHGS